MTLPNDDTNNNDNNFKADYFDLHTQNLHGAGGGGGQGINQSVVTIGQLCLTALDKEKHHLQSILWTPTEGSLKHQQFLLYE